MKKITLCLMACLGFISTAVNAQKISVAPVEVLPGTTASFTLSLSEGKADTYKSLQFDAKFPAGFNTVATDKETNTDVWPGSSATVNTVDADGVVTVPISSSKAIANAEVDDLVTINFSVASSVTTGTYQITLSKIAFGYGFTDKDYAPDVTFDVKVVDRLTLDEESTTAPAATDNPVKLLVKRTIKANTWSTICLPFEMSLEDWQSAFGTDAKIHRLSGYQKVGDAIKVKFGSALQDKMVANRPYVIKTSKDIKEFNVTAQIKSGTGKDKKVDQDDEDIVLAYMQGTFKAGTEVPQDHLFVNSGKFYYSDGTFKSKAFRAYFWFADKLASSRIIMSFDDETTGIKDLNVTDNDKVFDLQGRNVKTPAKGVYIKGGKKVLVK